MIVGTLGELVFEVSENTILTFDNMNITGSAAYAKHTPHLGKALVEFIGTDPQQISFDMTLSSTLGIDPASEISLIEGYEQTGAALVLVIGAAPLGQFKWVISKHTVKVKTVDGNGKILTCEVSVTLMEYV